MEAVKKYWLWGIFISILTVFAMSYNVSAISSIIDLSNYEIISNNNSLKANCTFTDMSNNVISTQTDVWTCTNIGDRNGVKLRQIYTTDTFTLKKGDIIEYDLLVWSPTTLDSMIVNFIGSPNSIFTMLGVNQVADNVYNLNIIADGDSTINGSGYYSVFRYTLKSNYDFTIGIGQVSGYQDYFIFKNGPLYVRFFNINQYRYSGSEENKEQEEKTQEAADASETAGGSSSTDAQQGTTSLINAITGAVTVISSASPTNCRINGNMGNLDMGQLDLCANPAPAFVTTIGSLILILMCVPLAITLFNRFISLFRSFQS